MSHSKPSKTVKKFCFICKDIYVDKIGNVSVFSVPKNKFANWETIVPGLKQTSKLCEKHFDEADIVKGLTVGQDFIPAQRLRLSFSAIPKHFLPHAILTPGSTRTPLKELFVGNNQQISKGDNSCVPTPAASAGCEASCTRTTKTRMLKQVRGPQVIERLLALDCAPGTASKRVNIASGCTKNNVQTNNITQIGNCDYEGEFGTSSWRLKINLPPVVLPAIAEDFKAADYTASRNNGGLIFATVNFFRIIQLVENVITKFFDNEQHIYVTNCYEEVMSELCKLSVINLCCHHHEESLPYLMMQYVHIRFHFESSRFRNLHLSKIRSKMTSNKKLSRTTSTAKIKDNKLV